MSLVEIERGMDRDSELDDSRGAEGLGASEEDAEWISTPTGSFWSPFFDEVRQLRAELAAARATIDSLRIDCSNLEANTHRLRRVASTDELTGLWNRRFLLDSLRLSHSFAVRQRLPLSVVMLDVDHFKAFNDDFGHAAGDETLRDVAALIQRCARDHDVAARYGGEEFVILLPGAGRRGAAAMAERLRRRVASRPSRFRPITASLGAATLRPRASQEPLGAAALLEFADLAMYQSKRRGRNQFTHADDIEAGVQVSASTRSRDASGPAR